MNIEKLPKEVLDKAEIIGNVFDELKQLQKALQEIEEIVNDDFCESISFDSFKGRLNEREKTAADKLSKIYMLSHGNNKSNSCYPVHEAWRK